MQMNDVEIGSLRL